jgi:hypothetical protein
MYIVKLANTKAANVEVTAISHLSPLAAVND